MTILEALRGSGAAGVPHAEATVESTLPLTSTVLVSWLGGQTTGKSGIRVTQTNALGIPAAYRAVALIATSSATLPLHAYEAAGAARIRVTDGPAAALLDNPHPDLILGELLELVFVSLLLHGNAYVLVARDRLGGIRELWWIDPSRVEVTRDKDGRKVYDVDGKYELRDAHLGGSMLHIPGLGYDGTQGASPLKLAREAFGLAIAAEEYGARLFGGGGLATGILTTEQRINDDTAREVKARWKDGGTGLDSAHDIRVIGSGATFTQLSIPPEDAQFIEARRFQISEIARIFGVPPHMLGETEKATSWGTGIEQQNIGFVTYTLRPWLTRVEQRISRIMPAGTYARFNVDGLLRGDSQQRAVFYREMWGLGALSTNDILALEEREPVPDGDTRWRPMNFAPLGSVDTAPDPAPADPVVPAAPDPQEG